MLKPKINVDAMSMPKINMQSVKRGSIEPHPAVGIIPLGTGNDMSRTFGWGTAFDKKWIKGHDALYTTLRMIADAKPTPLDRCVLLHGWHGWCRALLCAAADWWQRHASDM